VAESSDRAAAVEAEVESWVSVPSDLTAAAHCAAIPRCHPQRSQSRSAKARTRMPSLHEEDKS